MLQALGERPKHSLTLVDLMAASGYGKKAVRASVARLTLAGLVGKPTGTERKGIAITEAVEKVFSFKPADIVKQLNLLRPIYSKTTNYGHFGKEDAELTWEKTDKVKALLKAL